jgi:hypothetical protein
MAINWDDPCVRAAELRKAYYALVSGQGESLIRYRGPEGEQEVRYQSADLAKLQVEMRSAEAECAETNGTPNRLRRFAIRAGSRRC